MANLNSVMLIGRLTRDVEIRYMQSGAGVASFCIAVNDVWKDKSGEKKESVAFVDISVFGNQAEPCVKYLHKGSSVFIAGGLKYDTWEHEGKKHTNLSVKANNVQFLDSKENKEPEKESNEPELDI